MAIAQTTSVRSEATELPPSPESDEQLMRRIAASDETAFATFVDRHRAVALATAARVGPEAEEAVQEADLSAWRARSRFDSARGKPRSWYLAIVRNRAVDIARKRALRKQHQVGAEPLDYQVDDAPSPASEAMSSERRALVEAALTSLPKEQREVIRLRYYGELSHGEIARRIGAPLGTIKGRSRLALMRLRDEYSELLGDLAPGRSAAAL